MIKLTLPTWADKGELSKLKAIAFTWFAKVQVWLDVVFLRHDELTCPVFILDLLAYERNVERFSNEPLALYRKRVKYAFINAQEAGTAQGLINIFKRLGLGDIKVNERASLYAWDVISIELDPNQIEANEELLRIILKNYGRTCRRYQFETVSILPVNVAIGAYSIDYTTGICPKITI